MLIIALDSDIIHLNLMGTSLIVVNTREAARELFDRRSAIYSDKCVEFCHLAKSYLTAIV